MPGELDRYYDEVYLRGLLSVEDRISMHHGLETRLPFWSQPLLRVMEDMGIDERMKGGVPKGLLREAAQGFLPEAVFEAPKRGFPTPPRLWFRGELGSFVRSRLVDDPHPLMDELISRQEVAKLVRSRQKSPLPFALDERRAHRIWTLLFFDSWARQFSISELS